MSARGKAGTPLVSGAVVLGALAFCWLLLWLGPQLAEALVRTLGADNEAAVESLFTLVVFGTLMAAALALGAATGINAVAPGERAGRWTVIGFAIGASGVATATGYALLANTLFSGTQAAAPLAMILWGAAVVLVQAAGEEAFFRGWLQPLLARHWGAAVAVPVAAAMFAALHLMGGASDPLSLFNLFLGGLLFGTLAAASRGIAAPLAAHWAWNGIEQLVVGLDPNPGLGGFGALWDGELAGSALWGGSAEGLNASIGMSIALAALLVPLAMLVRPRLRAAPAARGQQG